MSPFPEVHVAVGVVTNDRGEVLIARRPDHLHQGGLWEFPGGKCEAGETARDALCRELREELSIEVLDASPWLTVRHAYPDRRVLLDVWRVLRFAGRAHGVEGQPVHWVAPDELRAYPFPPANYPIVAAARLPYRYAIVDLLEDNVQRMLERLSRLAESGMKLIQLRAKTLPSATQDRLARMALEYCRAREIALVLNSEPIRAHHLGADGVHLTAKRLLELSERPLARTLWVAASCHSLAELQHADRIGVDFAVLGPVLATASHPGARPLGWELFHAWVAKVNLPVYALGGMTSDQLTTARTHGAQGIAGIRGLLGKYE